MMNEWVTKEIKKQLKKSSEMQMKIKTQTHLKPGQYNSKSCKDIYNYKYLTLKYKIGSK